MRAFLALFVGSIASAALFGTFTTQSTSICQVQSVIDAPSVSTNLVEIHSISWPFGTFVSVPPTLNGRASTGQITPICMSGCADPPCAPVTMCNPVDLWWTTPYEGLLVPANTPIVLSDSLSPVPPTLALFYDEYVQPSPTPTGRPTSTAMVTPMSSALPTISPSAAAVVAEAAVAPVCNCAATPLSSVGAAGMTALTLLSLLGIVGMCACFQWNRTLRNSVACPYCFLNMPKNGLEKHLVDCKGHLLHYSPVVFERVHAVPIDVVVAAAGPDGEEDHVARPERVALTTTH